MQEQFNGEWCAWCEECGAGTGTDTKEEVLEMCKKGDLEWYD